MTATGLIDIHVHAAPSLWKRKHDVMELAAHCQDAGLQGFVLKSHFGSTNAQASLAADRTSEVDVYGSLTLNSFVGGFTPDAVTLAAETGCSVVWLPTFCAAHFESDRYFPFAAQSLTVFEESGELKPAVREVLAAIDDADRSLVLGNGHLSPSESRAVLDAIAEMGIETTYLITHADSAFMDLSVGDQVRFADRGAIIEKCYLPVVKGDLSLAAMAESIADIGAENCVLSTDHGQPDNDSPPAAFDDFVAGLRENGVADSEIQRMGRDVPVRILDEPL